MQLNNHDWFIQEKKRLYFTEGKDVALSENSLVNRTANYRMYFNTYLTFNFF